MQFMLRFFLAMVMSTCSIHLFGQVSDSTVMVDSTSIPTKKRVPSGHEVGINATFFIKQLLDLSENDIATSPYLFTYRMAIGKWGIRAGVGGTNQRTETSEEGFADTETQQDYSLDARLGVERLLPVGKRWMVNFGLDATTRLVGNVNIIETGFDRVETTTSTTGFGFGPVMGIQFFFNEHLSLYTEGSFYYTFFTTTTERDFTNFPQFNDEEERVEGQELLNNLPATLWLVYRF
ncbi:MAG: outer membrane beta-barrel protein [Bacteroidota bacterium]